MTALGGDASRLQAGRPATDDQDPPRIAGRPRTGRRPIPIRAPPMG